MKESNEIYRGMESSEVVKPVPYVVSEDIRYLLQSWADDSGFILPSEDFFQELRGTFTTRMEQLFRGYESVTERELSSGLNDIIATNGLIPVSLDRVYYRSWPRLDIARIVDEDGNSRGLGRRNSTPTLLRQFRGLRDAGVTKVALVDDVIFSGDLLERVADTIEQAGIQVPKVFAGIGIKEGVERIKASGREVACVKQYDKVLDEVCERDFYPGVPYSGRLVSSESNIGAPYILPFGDPVNWASIPPESQVSFSRFCIEQSILLFEQIENLSERQVTCQNLARKIVTLPTDNTRFVDVLRDIL